MAPYAQTDRRRWLALNVLCVAGLMIILDETIVNVALPSIQADLGVSRAHLAWVVNVYMIAFGGLLLLGGRLGDLIGRRRIFLVGLVVFTVASLLCGLAPSEPTLIAARVLQGIGGGLATSVVLGMIVTLFPDPREQAWAIGVNGFVASAGASVGLLAGGILTDAISWHWIFFVNVPIGAVTALLTLRFVEERPALGLARGADLPGAVLLTSGLMLAVYAILQVQTAGWGGTSTRAWGGLGIALLVAFVMRQRRIANPLMPLRLFRLRNMNGAILVVVLIIVGLFAVFFLGALYMRLLLGYTPLEVGLAFLPNTFAGAIVSLFVSGPASIRFGVRPAIVVGLVAIGVSLLLFARTPVDGSFVVDVMPAMVGIGIGEGLVFPVLARAAMAGVPDSDVGLASGFMGTLQTVGAAVGLAAVATLAAQRTATLRHRGEPFAAALNGGYHYADLVGAVLTFAAIGVAWGVLRPVEEEAEEARAREPACEVV